MRWLLWIIGVIIIPGLVGGGFAYLMYLLFIRRLLNV
jgi:hypothetical protein